MYNVRMYTTQYTHTQIYTKPPAALLWNYMRECAHFGCYLLWFWWEIAKKLLKNANVVTMVAQLIDVYKAKTGKGNDIMWRHNKIFSTGIATCLLEYSLQQQKKIFAY